MGNCIDCGKALYPLEESRNGNQCGNCKIEKIMENKKEKEIILEENPWADWVN